MSIGLFPFWANLELSCEIILSQSQFFVVGTANGLASLILYKIIGDHELFASLRTVPTIVTAHTFCASPDTRISHRQCLLIQGYFCAV